MATSVVTELLARELEGRLSFRIAAVLLFNGSMVIEEASLTIGQKLLRGRLGPLAARLANQRTFRAQFGRLFSPATRSRARRPMTSGRCSPATAAAGSWTG